MELFTAPATSLGGPVALAGRSLWCGRVFTVRAPCPPALTPSISHSAVRAPRLGAGVPAQVARTAVRGGGQTCCVFIGCLGL